MYEFPSGYNASDNGAAVEFETVQFTGTKVTVNYSFIVIGNGFKGEAFEHL